MTKVLDTTRQRVPEGEEPQEIPEPQGLQGVARRPTPLWPQTRETRTVLREQFRGLRDRVMRIIEGTGVLDTVADDAASYLRNTGRAKGPEGRGSAPLGDDKKEVIRRLWRRGPLKFLAESVEPETDRFGIEAGSQLSTRYTGVYNAGGQAAIRRLGVRASFDLRNPFLMDSLRTRANLLTGDLARISWDRIKTVVAEEFYLQGKGPPEVARQLRREFDWMSRVRADRIARTETLSIMSEAQNTTLRASGVQYKRWLTTLDGRERESHFAAHGQIQRMDDPFRVGAAELMYPGDISQHPEEVVNCRCDHLPVILSDQSWNDSTVWRGDVATDEFAKVPSYGKTLIHRISFQSLRDAGDWTC